MVNGLSRMRRSVLLCAAGLLLCMLTALPVMADKHITKYGGQDYSRVYDYDYYTTVTHPELAGERDETVLQYFVSKGMKKKEQANEDFNVIWYYNANPSLRYTYGTSWKKYYLYYQKKGYRTTGKVVPCTSIAEPIDYYMVGSRKISLKKIYSFEYFTKNNAAAYKYWKKQDDAGAVKYFVQKGMLAGMQGNETATRDSLAYRKLKTKIFPYFEDNEYMLADVVNSTTGYLILVNQGKHMVYIFKGRKHNWDKIMEFSCCIGAAGTPTTDGLWKIFLKRTYFITGGSNRCWYFTVVHADQGFHSEIYDSSDHPGPSSLVDGSMGVSISHGCMRVKLANAKWIFDNIPLKTRVKIYNCPFT